MACQRLLLSGALLLICMCHATCSLPTSQLFTFADADQHRLANDSEDFNSVELPLSTPIVFYQQTYHSIYINENGLVSFLTEIASFFSIPFPLDYPAIAPFYSDVDIRSRGAVWYRESRDSHEIKRVSRLVQTHFTSGRGFEARSLLIVTWDDVGYYDNRSDLANTFQLVVATDGSDSFVLFLFPDAGIQWIQGSGKNPNLPDARAQSGFVSGDGRFHLLSGSGADQVSSLSKLSNIGTAGYWMFRVGQIGDAGDVQLPDLATGDSALQQPHTAQTCAIGAVLCHSKAQCVDHQPVGFCCRCSAGFFGDGRNCLPEGVPQRINGKVSGSINGAAFREEDLHSYVVTSDGRAYTAVSKVSETVGYDLQTLNAIGAVVGWMFARPTSQALNGYQLTGGRFNFSSVVEFPQSGQRAVVEQRFLGVDVFNYLRMSVAVSGDVPTIPHGSKVDVADYEEEYIRTGPGQFQAKTRRALRLEGSALDIPFTVEHSVQFDECPYADAANSTVFKLKVGRNFVTYDVKEQIVRYAMTCKVSTVDESDDPCVKGRATCVPDSTCVADGDTFRCVCNKGFEYLYDEGQSHKGSCVDVNECNTGHDRCDENALCINEPGSYACRCKSGFFGDGFTCQRETACMRVRCRAHSQCVESADGSAQCLCLPGYLEADGQCRPVSFAGGAPSPPAPDCRQTDICDMNALCEYDSQQDAFRCRCQRGFVGDGLVCSPQSESCHVVANCSPYAACDLDDRTRNYTCRCLPGFEGDGRVCVRPTCVLGVCWCPDGHQYVDGKCQRSVISTDVPQVSCNEVNICHPHAQCIRSTRPADGYVCQCNAGYQGDGFHCSRVPSARPLPDEEVEEEEEELSCDLNDICGQHATCIFNDDTLKSVCVCNEGFRGDGINCSPLDGCSAPSDCDPNAQCQFSGALQKFLCQCNEGFQGDGHNCLFVPPSEHREPDCHQLRNCHADAACTLDDASGRHVCVCRSGFSGDGIDCRPTVIGCNAINNCHVQAECLYNDTAAGFRCKCRHGYTGDGIVCRPSVSCADDQNVCHANAFCDWDAGGYHTCRCGQGFKGDGYLCQAVPKHDSDFLLISHGMSILRVPVKSSPRFPGRPIYIQIFQAAVGIDIDCDQGRVYWSDVNGQLVRSAKYDGSDAQVFLSADIGSPEGLAVDWVSRNIYWTDSLRDTIEVASLDTKVRRVLFNSSLVNPRGIAVHPSRGLLFWTDWNREEPKIERSEADGSNRQVLVTSDVKLPNSLTVDYDGERLCWADAGVFRIECSDLDGQKRRVIRSDVKHPFGLTLYQGALYWTDWLEKAIHSADLESGQAGASLPVPLGGQGKIYAVVAVPATCPSAYTHCQVGAGGCQAEHQLCLPSSTTGRTCL